MPRIGRPISASLVLAWVAAGLLFRLVAPLGPALGQTAKTELGKYSVDGLSLDGTVHPESSVYKQYDCEASTQFKGLTVCRRKKTENKAGETITLSTTIYHGDDGKVAYVNRFVEPARFEPGEIDGEIGRLSAKYGQKAQLLSMPQRPGVADARIAYWGSLRLVPLSAADIAVARQGRSPEKGILVDFLGDYPRSAQLDLPVYSIEGDYGFVWISSSNDQGRGNLRFFAINARRMSEARQDSPSPPLAPVATAGSPSAFPAVSVQPPAAAEQKKQAELTQKLTECGESCPDKPELDKLRLDTLQAVQQQQRAAEDADSFVAALGHEEALTAYISSCSTKVCDYVGDATRERDALRQAKANQTTADAEERQYRAARGSISALKTYISDCSVCLFIRDASNEINEAASKAADSLFKFTVCNKDYAEVSIGVAAKRDPSQDMWTAEGWWNVPAGDCKFIGSFAKGYFYYTAYSFSRRIYWPSDEDKNKTFCIPNDKFSVLLYDGHECSGVGRGFVEAKVDSSEWTWNLKAAPWKYSALAAGGIGDGSWGWSPNQDSQEEAESQAVQWCSRNELFGCHIVDSIRSDMCLALATGNDANGDSVWGSASRQNRFDARNAAMSACREHGGPCFVKEESCSP